jgi:hypothetical protein
VNSSLRPLLVLSGHGRLQCLYPKDVPGLHGTYLMLRYPAFATGCCTPARWASA